MKTETINNFKYGIIDSIEDFSIPRGAASASLGWLTLGDRIELVRGRHLLGTEITGVGRVSGLRVGFLSNGTQVLFRTYGNKALYYDTVTSDWIEIGTDKITGAVTTADPYGEDISMERYSSLSGSQLWLNSPNSSIFKIMVANPATAISQYDSSKNFKGKIKIKSGRMFLWDRGPSGATLVTDKTGLYGSKIDRDEVSDYTHVTSEALGVSGSTTYAGTLSTISGKKTCFGITITDGTETFVDDKSGNLIGSLGGTGTINYATGAYSVTFNSAASGSVVGDYYTEDSSVSGIADFTKSGTRLAGEGFVIRQDDAGGIFQNLALYNSIFYCIHALKTWALSLSDDDLTATNKIYREKVGVPYWRVPVETGDGTYYIDDTDENNPRVRLLTISSGSTEVIPVPLSNNVSLVNYRFDKSAGIESGDYVVWACRTSNSPVNNRLLLYNRLWKCFDLVPYYASTLENYNGVLVCGDSLSNNAYELFSGLDDDESTIENYWVGSADDLSTPGLKKSKKIVLEGNIGPDQSIRVYVSIDKGAYVEIGLGAVSTTFPDGEPAIYGGGAYVDRSQRVDVGSPTIGRTEIGGGSELTNGVEAYHYKREFRLNQDRFERIKVRFIAQGIGYASVSLHQWKDVRHKSNKVPQKYRV